MVLIWRHLNWDPAQSLPGFWQTTSVIVSRNAARNLVMVSTHVLTWYSVMNNVRLNSPGAGRYHQSVSHRHEKDPLKCVSRTKVWYKEKKSTFLSSNDSILSPEVFKFNMTINNRGKDLRISESRFWMEDSLFTEAIYIE